MVNDVEPVASLPAAGAYTAMPSSSGSLAGGVLAKRPVTLGRGSMDVDSKSGPTKEVQIFHNLNQLTAVHQYRDQADPTGTIPGIRRKVEEYIQGVHAYAENEHNAAIQARSMADFANAAGTAVCQQFASHELHAAECLRDMNEELHGYKQLAASEARVRAKPRRPSAPQKGSCRREMIPHLPEEKNWS